MLKRTKWYFHPIFIFVFSIFSLGLSLFLYIYWYMEVSIGLDAIIRRYQLDRGQILESRTWVVIVVLSILVGIITIGILVIFVYNLKLLQLYRLQNNFINNFTHELKTPVTSLKLYLETFLKHEIPRNDQLKYLRFMISDVNRLSDNINSILNLGKIESKISDGEFIASDLVFTIERFCKSNEHLFGKCKIVIDQNIDNGFVYEINPMMFDMVLMNIITNAIKYNESENPEIKIDFKKTDYHIHICFTDNGIGIEKAELRRIFKKFYQVGQSDNRTAKGSGVGLYLAENIMRIHKGRLFAESKGLGKGTTFCLKLPREIGKWNSQKKNVSL